MAIDYDKLVTEQEKVVSVAQEAAASASYGNPGGAEQIAKALQIHVETLGALAKQRG